MPTQPKSAISEPQKFAVERKVDGIWYNAGWMIHDEPEDFDSREEAEAAIDEQVVDVAKTYPKLVEAHSRQNYRVVPVEELSGQVVPEDR